MKDTAAAGKRNPLRRLYDWVIRWAGHPHAITALFLLALAEASFFPVPPDVLLITMCIAACRRWIWFATVCTIGSTVGGILGYGIGYAFRDSLGWWLLIWIAQLTGGNAAEIQALAHGYYQQYGAWAVGIAGFTPIPYKVFTITAGWFEMNFPTFAIVSCLSRGMRFFLVAGLIGITYEKYGDRITKFIDKQFNWLTILFVILLVGGFLVLKVLR
ncbi:VTT domain-containing protein [bacterium]|nr:VTT domain-containing protein [bacterium]MBU1984959.1 VTT domain-containing protein [bacterium]